MGGNKNSKTASKTSKASSAKKVTSVKNVASAKKVTSAKNVSSAKVPAVKKSSVKKESSNKAGVKGTAKKASASVSKVSAVKASAAKEAALLTRDFPASATSAATSAPAALATSAKISAPAKKSKVYDESQIKHLDALEHIRLRSGMYIGRLGDGSNQNDGIYVLLKEVIDNAVDEFIMGYGKRIDVDVVENTVKVRDYGRGIPLGKVVECVSEINTGAKYNDDVFQFSVGMNGVGTKAVNALSSHFRVVSVRKGECTEAVFESKSRQTVLILSLPRTRAFLASTTLTWSLWKSASGTMPTSIQALRCALTVRTLRATTVFLICLTRK